MNNYYKPDAKNKLLHFFEWRSRNLHILPLDDIETNLSQAKFTKILLDISFVIPDFHTSLSTPDGEIYLLGGRNAKNHDEKYNQVYTVDFQRKELVKKAPMRYKRDSHAICYNEGYIYVIGGVTFDKEKKKSVLRACERYNVARDEWTEIARVNMPVCNHCACVFQNKYIFCFGGRCQPEKLSNNIFRYTIEEDSWLCIKLQDSMQIRNKFAMTSQAGCCQINEDNIFVFGGYNENRTASNQSFLFSYSSNSSYNGGLNSLNSTHDDHSNSMLQESEDKKKDICRIKQLNVKKINSAAPFWDKQVIVNNGKIYCLQNDVAAHNARLVYGNRRRLLIFDGTKWSNVN